MHLPEQGVTLSHLAKDQTIALAELYRNFPDIQVEIDLLFLIALCEEESRAQRGMSSELQLFFHGENPHTIAAFAFDSLVSRKDESRLRKIGLFGKALQLLVRNTARIGKD